MTVRVLQRNSKDMESGLKESDSGYLAGSNQVENSGANQAEFTAETGGNQSDASGSLEEKSKGAII